MTTPTTPMTDTTELSTFSKWLELGNSSGCNEAAWKAWQARAALASTSTQPNAAVPAKPTRHKFWGAGEPDCPKDIKASNGELHTMRCKVCGDDWRKSRDVCLAATPPPVAGDQEMAKLATKLTGVWVFMPEGNAADIVSEAIAALKVAALTPSKQEGV